MKITVSLCRKSIANIPHHPVQANHGPAYNKGLHKPLEIFKT